MFGWSHGGGVKGGCDDEQGGVAMSFGGEKYRGARPQAEFRLELARDACRGFPDVVHN